MTDANRPTDLILAALAAARLSRLITTDYLGEWILTGPARAWGERHEEIHRIRLLSRAAHPAGTLRILPDDQADPFGGPALLSEEPLSWQKRLTTGA